MELVRDKWSIDDIKEFQEYLKSLENPSKREWSKKLLKTELPVLCMQTSDMKRIIKEIAQGNYLSFLDHMVWEYYENTAINGFLIMGIKDFGLMRKYLDIYSAKADNWATCDLLIFKIEGNEDKYYNLARDYIDDEKPFRRRIGLSILFNFVSDLKYADNIYSILDGLQNEEHYYVNMMGAWLFCELFIKQREKALKYLENNRLNKFILNKGIQKCRESLRVSALDKEMLLKYKKLLNNC